MHSRSGQYDRRDDSSPTAGRIGGRNGFSRRDVLSLAGWLSLAASSWLALRVGLSYLIPPFSYGVPSKIRAGKPADLPMGSRRLLQRERVLIIRDPGGFRALSAVCTHLGCTVTLMEWGFNCPCHGSKFDWDGVNFAGPAPRPLDSYGLSLAADGELIVDTSRTVPHDELFDPASPEAAA